MDVCVLAAGVMVSVLLVGSILGRRHGRTSALAALAGISLLSLAAALAAYFFFGGSPEAKPDPSNGWHKMTVPGGRVVDLRYKSERGLSIITEDEETTLFREVPFCLTDGQLAKLAVNFVETTNDPYVALPEPLKPFEKQISFNLSYAIGTTGLGASSFGIDQSGELWCTEALYRASTAGTDNSSLALASVAILVFTGSFAAMVIPAAVILEIRRRRQNNRHSL